MTQKAALESPFHRKMSDLFRYLDQVDLKSSLQGETESNKSASNNNTTNTRREANYGRASRHARNEGENTSSCSELFSAKARQESLNVEEERAKAREWARQMRTAVTKWLEEDQRLSKQYREETEAAVSSYKAAIVQLEAKLNSLEIKSKNDLERYLLSEEKMQTIILSQQEQILRLEMTIKKGTRKGDGTSPMSTERVQQESSVAFSSPQAESSPSTSSLVENPPSATSDIIRNQQKRIKEQEHQILDHRKPALPKKQIRFADQVPMVNDSDSITPPQKSEVHDSIECDQGIQMAPTPFPTKHIGSTPFPSKTLDTPGGSVAISPDDSIEESCDGKVNAPRNARLNAMDDTKRNIRFEDAPVDEKAPTPPRPRRVRMESPQGNKIIRYGNGATKEIRSDGVQIVTFSNGDVQTRRHGLESYFYSATGVLSILQPDGSTIWEFPSGQVEQHFPDGQREVIEYARASPESGYISVSDIPADQLIVE